MRQLSLVILLLALLVVPVFGADGGMVTKCSENGEVVINRGVEDNVTPGTHWYIYRAGKPLAELEVTLVDSYSCTASVVSGGMVRVGDTVSEKPFAKTPDKSEYPVAVMAPPPAAETSPSGAPKNQLTNRNPGAPVQEETAESTEKRLSKLMSTQSKGHKFSGGGSKLRQTSVNPLHVANIFSATANGTNWTTWQNVLSVGLQEVGTNVSNKKHFKECRLQVDVTYWNEDLLNAYSDSLAFKEGRSSQEQRLAMRTGLYCQKGLDKFLVFNVKMKNVGPGTVQLERFDWHIFLVDSHGNRIKAERYDQILDRAMNPDQGVEGNVYFLRVDSSGRDIAEGKKGVTLVFEDVLGERAEIKFK